MRNRLPRVRGRCLSNLAAGSTGCPPAPSDRLTVGLRSDPPSASPPAAWVHLTGEAKRSRWGQRAQTQRQQRRNRHRTLPEPSHEAHHHLATSVYVGEMNAEATARRTWRSDTLLLAGLNAGAYLWSYSSSGWEVPHFGGYVCWIGAIISFVPAPREIGTPRFRRAALLGFALSCAVLWHIFTTPCTGPCK